MANPEATEERILDACRRLYREGGPRALTTRAVATAAGVNEVTLFRHFNTKGDLVRAMVAHTVSGVSRDLPPPNPSVPLVDTLTAWARAYLEHLAPVADMVLASLAESRWDEEICACHAEFARQVPEALARHLEAIAAGGQLPPQDFLPTAEMLHLLLLARLMTEHVAASPLDLGQYARDVARVFAAALGAPAS